MDPSCRTSRASATARVAALAKAVDIPLLTHGDDLIVHSEAMTSRVAQSVLVGSLLTGVSIGRRDVILRNLFATREAVESARL